MRIHFILFYSLICLGGAAIAQEATKQISQNKVETEFKKHSPQIEGSDRDCWIVNTFIGDLNGDGINDVIVQYGCGFKGNIGNANAGGGLAIFTSKNDSLVFIGNDENYYGFVPSKISGGIIYGEKLSYAENDAKCCPSIKEDMKFKLINNKLVKVN